MNETLIANHNSVVKPGDIVWHDGDFCFREYQIAAILARLNGEHYLISGNHDKTFRGSKKWEAARERYVSYGFKEVLDETHIGTPPHVFRLCHFPYEQDSRHGARYSQYHPKDEGEWLLHGHCHTKDWLIKDRQIDVGVDGHNYFPWSLDELIALKENPSLADSHLRPHQRPIPSFTDLVV
jgi:calcineurin-like phosphoesterase family protein